MCLYGVIWDTSFDASTREGGFTLIYRLPSTSNKTVQGVLCCVYLGKFVGHWIPCHSFDGIKQKLHQLCRRRPSRVGRLVRGVNRWIDRRIVQLEATIGENSEGSEEETDVLRIISINCLEQKKDVAVWLVKIWRSCKHFEWSEFLSHSSFLILSVSSIPQTCHNDAPLGFGDLWVWG